MAAVLEGKIGVRESLRGFLNLDISFVIGGSYSHLEGIYFKDLCLSETVLLTSIFRVFKQKSF